METQEHDDEHIGKNEPRVTNFINSQLSFIYNRSPFKGEKREVKNEEMCRGRSDSYCGFYSSLSSNFMPHRLGSHHVCGISGPSRDFFTFSSCGYRDYSFLVW